MNDIWLLAHNGFVPFLTYTVYVHAHKFVNVPLGCRFTLFKLYSTVPFVAVALTLIDPLLRLHPLGSTLVHVLIVTTLVVAVIVSDAASVHPLYVPVTV